MGLRICFYGGPCVGKSTLAAWVYAELNKSHLSVKCELVQEFIKQWAYEGRQVDAFDQVYSTASQLWAEHRLFKAGVQVIVTDSPVLLQCAYANRLDSSIGWPLHQIAEYYETKHKTLNFYVQRDVRYEHHGRFQTLKEAQVLDDQIIKFLGAADVKYIRMKPHDFVGIMQIIKEEMRTL